MARSREHSGNGMQEKTSATAVTNGISIVCTTQTSKSNFDSEFRKLLFSSHKLQME